MSDRLRSVLVRLLPPGIRAEHGEEVVEHLAWLQRVHSGRLGPIRFWLFIWADFVRVAVTGRPWVRPAMGVALVAAVLLAVSDDRASQLPSIPFTDIQIQVVSGEEGRDARFSTTVDGGIVDVRDLDGVWRRLEPGEDFGTPAQMRFRGGSTEVRFASSIGSPEVALLAETPGATLRARGDRITLYRDPTRVGVRVR